MAMTPEDFAQLRHEAEIRALMASTRPDDRTLATYVLPPEPVPPFVPPAAGDWFHDWPGKRWHRATGDMKWRPRWDRPSVVAACGYRTSAGFGSPLERAAVAPDGGACKNCLARR